MVAYLCVVIYRYVYVRQRAFSGYKVVRVAVAPHCDNLGWVAELSASRLTPCSLSFRSHGRSMWSLGRGSRIQKAHDDLTYTSLLHYIVEDAFHGFCNGCWRNDQYCHVRPATRIIMYCIVFSAYFRMNGYFIAECTVSATLHSLFAYCAFVRFSPTLGTIAFC